MRRDEELVREVAKGILAEWLDGTYFAAPTDHTGTSPDDWHLRLTDEPGPGDVYHERTTGRNYRIEMRVTRL